MKIKTFYIKNIGEVDFVRNKRAKYLRITVKPCGKVRVTLPFGYTYDQGRDFVLQKIQHVQAALEKIQENRKIFDENSDFKTRNHSLKISAHAGKECAYHLKEGRLEFYYPKNSDITELRIQNAIKSILIEVMRQEAKDYLPLRVEKFAKKYSFKYKKVYVKNLKTRWGSCSSVNNINLNLHLIRLPDYLADYVILHELVHTEEKNHGKGFWKLLDSLVANSRQLDRQLKNYSTQL